MVQLAGRKVLVASIEQLADEPRDDGEFLPFTYGAHRVAAHLLQPEIPGLELVLRSYWSNDADAIAADFAQEQPDILALSCYVWSAPSLLAAALRHKARWPQTTVVLGGPSARPAMLDHPAWLQWRPAIDAVVVGEGEEVLREIVLLGARTAHDLQGVPGLRLPLANGRTWHTTPPRVLGDLDALASPHQLGIAPRRRTGHLETYRGCPLACAFCEWGVASPANRVFSAEYLVRELQAYRDTGALGAFLVDAGLNMNRRGLRHLMQAEREVRFFADHPLSTEIYAGWLREEDLQFLSEVRHGRLGVGLQTAESDVLKKLGRPHDSARFARGVEQLSEIGRPIVELMLGLPFDSPAGFWRSLQWALALPCAEVHVFWTLVLPDGLMTRAPAGADCSFDPYSLRIERCAGWTHAQLLETAERMHALAREMGGEASDSYWSLPVGRQRQAVQHPDRHVERMFDKVEGVRAKLLPVAPDWRLEHAQEHAGSWRVDLATPHGTLTLTVQRASPQVRAFQVHAGVAVSHTTDSPSAATAAFAARAKALCAVLAKLFEESPTAAPIP